MANYSVPEAKNRLSELIDRALKGDAVVITRHGRPVAVLKPVAQERRVPTKVDLEWLRARRVGRGIPKEDAGALVSRMRDEEWR